MPAAIDTVEDLWKSVKKRIYMAAWSEANREKISARKKADRNANPEKFRARNKVTQEKDKARRKARRAERQKRRDDSREARHEANREKDRIRSKASRAANPEKTRAIERACKTKNREKYNAKKRAWGKSHPEKARSYSAKRRARKRGATIGDTSVIMAWEISWKRLKRVTCHWCCNPFPPKRCHVDHAVPLSKGGAHSLENLVVSCAPCNFSKNAKLPGEWNKQLSEPALSLF